jgi:hypothetical protein
MERLPTRVLTRTEKARLDREHLDHLLRNSLDWELWRDNRHMLPVRVRKAMKRGEVRQLSTIVEYLPGLAEVYVQRLKPRPSRWRRSLIITGVAFAAAGVVLWMLYVIFQVLLVALAPALVILAIVWIIFHLVSEHGSGCKGWHCPGCRG